MASYSTGAKPVATTDNYPAAGQGASLLCPGSGQVVVTIANAAAVVNIGYGRGGAPAFEATEHFYAPGVWPITSKAGLIDALRVRSAAAGLPANVAISAYG